jgi:hypothetical protein
MGINLQKRRSPREVPGASWGCQKPSRPTLSYHAARSSQVAPIPPSPPVGHGRPARPEYVWSARAALLAIVGSTFLLACIGAFFLLGVPAKRNWWLALALPLLAIANITVAFVVIPADHVGIALVLDAYLFNGLLTLVLVILLLKRPVRSYFGIARPLPAAKAA